MITVSNSVTYQSVKQPRETTKLFMTVSLPINSQMSIYTRLRKGLNTTAQTKLNVEPGMCQVWGKHWLLAFFIAALPTIITACV